MLVSGEGSARAIPLLPPTRQGTHHSSTDIMGVCPMSEGLLP